MSLFSHNAPLSRLQLRLCLTCMVGGLLLSLLLCTWLAPLHSTCEELRTDTLRLHVRASGNSVFDQTVKLRVRDALLAQMEALAPALTDKSQALRMTAQNLLRFQLAARLALVRLGLSVPVRLSLTNQYFSTTHYPTFSLPAGRYDALCVELGREGHYGRNWWCVLYPSLCLSACSGGYQLPTETDLITGNYIVRFRLVECWQSATASRQDRPLLTLSSSPSPQA